MTQSVGRVMRAKGSGVIVCLGAGTSETSKEAGAYLTSKAAVSEFAHQADRELSRHGVRVHVVDSFAEAMRVLEDA